MESTEMIQELDTVVLARDMPEVGLEKGDIGVVVHCYVDNQAFEVEFVTGAGKTVALLTLSPQDLRPMGQQDMLHVRVFAPA